MYARWARVKLKSAATLRRVCFITPRDVLHPLDSPHRIIRRGGHTGKTPIHRRSNAVDGWSERQARSAPGFARGRAAPATGGWPRHGDLRGVRLVAARDVLHPLDAPHRIIRRGGHTGKTPIHRRSNAVDGCSERQARSAPGFARGRDAPTTGGWPRHGDLRGVRLVAARHALHLLDSPHRIIRRDRRAGESSIHRRSNAVGGCSERQARSAPGFARGRDAPTTGGCPRHGDLRGVRLVAARHVLHPLGSPHRAAAPRYGRGAVSCGAYRSISTFAPSGSLPKRTRSRPSA